MVPSTMVWAGKAARNWAQNFGSGSMEVSLVDRGVLQKIPGDLPDAGTDFQHLSAQKS